MKNKLLTPFSFLPKECLDVEIGRKNKNYKYLKPIFDNLNITFDIDYYHHPFMNLILNRILHNDLKFDNLLVIDYLENNYNNHLNFLKNGELFILQHNFAIPEFETRNLRLEIDINPNFDYIYNVYDYIDIYFHEELIDYLNIIKSITVVNVITNKTTKYFSGGWDTCWGNIHIKKPENMIIFLEQIIHEAGHFWLNTFEIIFGDFFFETWDQNSFHSPWRSDLRPMPGIIHGLFVFCNVIFYFENSKLNPQIYSERVNFLKDKAFSSYNYLIQNAHPTSIGNEVLSYCKKIINIENGLG